MSASTPMIAKNTHTARNSQDLLDAGIISVDRACDVDQTSENFSMAVTPSMISLIDSNNPADPISQQFVPSREELNILPEELNDPIGDDPFTPVKGITHRYPDRVLLKPTHVCPVYCRFCFRREKVGTDGEGLSLHELETAFDYIRQHPQIWEVILTGGDPMILPKPRMAKIISTLDAIAHVDVIRIHTRVPVVDPDRINEDMIRALKVDTPVYVVLHTNHPRELTDEAKRACALMVDNGIPMLSQSVLLKGINDDAKTLETLMRSLIRMRVKPYYLHHGDLAQGTSHFRTTILEGQELMKAIRGNVSGICQPTYILDIPGGQGKVPIHHQYLTATGEAGQYQVEDPWGNYHSYASPASGNNSGLTHALTDEQVSP